MTIRFPADQLPNAESVNFRMSSDRPMPQKYFGAAKRTFDVCFCLLAMPIILPVIAVLWLMVRRDGGPGFFSHQRVGKNAAMFGCLKLRTMCVDAEERLTQYLAQNPEAAAEWEQHHKLTNDPRITRLGNILRKTSLDELPQFINVLLGDMSVVGPRPVTAVELDRYGAGAAAYCSMRPGITGPWQVSGRNDISYQERVDLDVDYLTKASIWTDIKLVFLTVGAVLKMTGK